MNDRDESNVYGAGAVMDALGILIKVGNILSRVRHDHEKECDGADCFFMEFSAFALIVLGAVRSVRDLDLVVWKAFLDEVDSGLFLERLQGLTKAMEAELAEQARAKAIETDVRKN